MKYRKTRIFVGIYVKKLGDLLLARCFYFIGRLLFKTGLAGWSEKIHHFSMRQLQRSADLGFQPALLLFGQILSYRGVTPMNKRRGIEYLATLAEQSVQAQFMLAEQLVHNKEVIIPNHNPLSLYQAAAEQGHAMAALRLSQAYKDGKWGAQQDLQLAQTWSERFHQHSRLQD
ncbi:hypothetical protein RED65_11555 [Oceanobacter sp. RED65]|uniref:Sel1 repeat family protein n=1 Tax=Bermanella marisrubri TaxID=207949 RepID=Q1N177_9GAMM|nr:hypothetical protein RED65_11555 [Oceanobacter sp. RED65] [Bermanella marisrubri]